MKILLHAAVLAVTATLPVLADEQLVTATPELIILCPKLDGKSITDSAGAKYSVSCDWTMETEGKAVRVEGRATPLMCMEACEESDDCYSINIAADGACSLISGKEKGMAYSAGLINLFRLPQPASTTSRVQITTTRRATTSNAVTTVDPRPITTTVSAAPAAAAAAAAGCDLDLNNLCPACDDTIARDASGNSYLIYCDKSLFTNGTYSVQEYLSPEGCMKECDDLSWCLGASYYDDRSCEIAKGPVVYTVAEAGYTAFLPVAVNEAAATSVPTSASVSVRSIAANRTTTSLVPDSTVSILPISNACNTSALTCPACDGHIVQDTLNQTYTALCTFAPVCDRTAIASGPITQDECMQSCDQDGICLAVLWYTDRNACHLCQQGLDGGPGSDLDFVLLVADIDGDDDSPDPTNSSSTSSRTSSTTTRPSATPYLPSYRTGSLEPPAPYSRSGSSIARSTSTSRPSTTFSTPLPTTSPSSPSTAASLTMNPVGPFANTTRSASVPDISAVACPGLGQGVFFNPTGSNLFDVMCDGIITAAQSRFTTASDFAACVAACTGDCDGVQFGYTSRCGLYHDISTVGSASGWTIATSLSYPRSTSIASVAPMATGYVRVAPVVAKRAAGIP